MDDVAGGIDEGKLVQRFVEYLPDCAVIILDVDGNVLTWNAGARSILGYAADEIVGQPFSRLYVMEDIAAARPTAALGDALARGRHEETGRLVRKDGTKISVQSVLIPLYDARERHVGFGNLTRDVGASAQVEAGKTQAQTEAPNMGPEAVQILVVDDDEQIRNIAVRQLVSLGYRVVQAPGGAEALKVLTCVLDIDLLFVDMVMPGGMGGREVAEAARRLRPGLKVLFASGYFEGPDCNDADGTHCLGKPYRKKDLAQKVQEVLGASAS